MTTHSHPSESVQHWALSDAITQNFAECHGVAGSVNAIREALLGTWPEQTRITTPTSCVGVSFTDTTAAWSVVGTTHFWASRSEVTTGHGQTIGEGVHKGVCVVERVSRRANVTWDLDLASSPSSSVTPISLDRRAWITSGVGGQRMAIDVHVQGGSYVVINVRLFHVWQQEEVCTNVLMISAGIGRWECDWAQAAWWEALVSVMEVVQRQALLLQVVGALHTASSFTSSLNCRKQQANQNTDDGDNHQQFD
jgi:hypothetical protein